MVLDATVLIAHLDPADAHHASATQLLLAHADEDFAASVLTVAEVLVHAFQAGAGNEVSQALDALGVQVIPLMSFDALRLAELRAASRLKMPDCCVLLAASDRGSSLATFDERLAASARARGLDVSP